MRPQPVLFYKSAPLAAPAPHATVAPRVTRKPFTRRRGDLSQQIRFASQVVFGLLLGVFGWALYMSLKKANAVRDAPVERVVAVIVKERMDLRQRFGDRRQSLRTYVIVQTRDGQRHEYFAPKHVAGRYAVDDIGIVYVKADVLVDFLRVDV